jgi:hypothetical protein
VAGYKNRKFLYYLEGYYFLKDHSVELVSWCTFNEVEYKGKYFLISCEKCIMKEENGVIDFV